MRDFLDAILAFINSESLTDEEFDGIDLSGPPAYTEETYVALKQVINAREGVSNQDEKLKYYFMAAGIEFSDSESAKPPKSNILIGSEL